MSDIAKALNQECHSRKIKREDIVGIGVGVPGTVLEEHIVNKCVNLGWGMLDVTDELGKLTGISNIKAGNDANKPMAAITKERRATFSLRQLATFIQ